MSTSRIAQGNWAAGPDDSEEWMQLIDWEMLEWEATLPLAPQHGYFFF